MAEKTSNLTIKVDVACDDCKKKIEKTICKLEGKGNATITYDEKANTVTISGKFDAQKLCNKLCCKDYVIKSIQITMEPKKKPPPKEEDCKVINKIRITVGSGTCRGTCRGGCKWICKKD
uniref:Protein PYRICULARIA ORYZAE RESISTANCE 21 n=1 Tax=Elaeis guineensis var. tenera TaxID=51953 RepID=A0A6I9S2A8_ELAGV|nr:protein PYRICULARIA ORYZAE RESISTANCE 21 [Elaeis guineensis]